MRLVPNPGDGIVAAVGEAIGKEQGVAKNIFDICCVASTCLLGLIAAGRIVGVGVGTVAAMILWAGDLPGQPSGEGKNVHRRRASGARPVISNAVK